jgi:hypothetical protein
LYSDGDQLIDEAQRGAVQLVVELAALVVELAPAEGDRRPTGGMLAPAALKPMGQPGPPGLDVERPARRACIGCCASGPVEAHVCALTLYRSGAAGADDPGRVLVQVLAAAVIEAVVVGAQERADHRAYGVGVVAERLAGEHRGELQHACAVFSGGVAAAGQPYGRVAWGRLVVAGHRWTSR